MNVWRIALKEIKAVRDIKTIVFLILTPVLIILILGAVLTNAFNGSVTVGDIRVLYKINGSGSELTKSWNVFADQASKSGMTLEPANENTDGKLEVANNRYVGYVEISDGGLNYYGNSSSPVESGIAQGLLTAFANRYKLASVAADNSDQAALMSGNGSPDYVRETSLDAARQPRALDYYAIAMVTMIIMYSALSAADMFSSERKRNTSARLLAAPISKAEIFAGKVAGNLLMNVICTVIVVLVCKYMFNVYWGENLGLVFLVLITEIIFALSVGLGFSYLLKGKAAGSVIMMVIQAGAFVGGSYFPVAEMTGVMRTITQFSPLEWSNTGILQIIYGDGWSAAAKAILLNLGFSVFLLSAAAIIMRRREGL